MKKGLLKQNTQIVTILLLLSLLFSCNKNNKTKEITKEVKPISEINIQPKTTIINYDSIKVITIGENNVPLPQVVKFSKPTVKPYRNATIISGKSYLPQSEEEISTNKKKILYTKPKVTQANDSNIYYIVNATFNIQKGDTIFAPEIINVVNKPTQIRRELTGKTDTIYPLKTTKRVQPLPINALPPRYKDNAVLDIKYLDVDQGLASSNIMSILEDSKGNIWFGTWGGGVSCYDGKTILTFTEKEGLSNNTINSIFEDSKGNIWFGTYGGGLSLYNGKTFTNFTENEGLYNNNIKIVIEDSKGNIWFGTWGNGVSFYNGKSFTTFTTKNGLSSNNINTLTEDSKGNIWIGTYGGGINIFNGKSFTRFTVKEGLSNNNINSIIEDSKGKIWIGTWGSGASCYNGKTFTNYTTKEGLCNNVVNSIIEDSKGNIWFGTYGGGVSCFNGESFSTITEEDGLSNNVVISISEDSKGNIWFATLGGGAACYNNKSFIHFTTNEGLSNNIIKSIAESKNKDIWFGTWGGGLSLFDDTSFTHIKKSEGLSKNIIWSILVDKKGNSWFGTYGKGVSYFDGETFTKYTETQGLCSNYIRSINEDSKGNIWFSSYGNGVSRFDGKSFITFTEKEGLANNTVWSILEDSKKNIWFATYGGGASLFNGESFTTYTEQEGLSNNSVRTILEDKNGNIWFGTSSGVSIFNGKSFTNYTEKDGLSNNTINSISEDKNGNIWLSTDKGLSLFILNKDSISLINKENIRIIKFGILEGLKGLDFYANSSLIDSKNRIWWSSNRALTMLDLNKFNISEHTPKIQLNNIELNEEFIDFNNIVKEFNNIKFDNVQPFYNYPNNLELPYNLNHITFNFSAIDWTAPNQIKYSFILSGLDNTWSVPSYENKVDYRNIPYGKYIFKVKAIGISGKWSEPFEYSFTIHPPWWHSWWARILYIFLGIFVIYYFVKWRTAKLHTHKKNLEKTVKERTEEVVKQNREISEKNEELNMYVEEITTQRDEIELQRDNVRKQKEIIEITHKHLTESIDYAQSLQQSILPEKQLLEEYLDDHFVLFKPKDKVSGDFYWWTHIENHTVITAADCTGHGVPGAFMSMLGISFLREVVIKEYITHTGVILRKLRKEIIKVLQQKGEIAEQKDGIDMALISINAENNLLQFSGANNPLYIVRKGELKTDNELIRLYEHDKPSEFKLYELKPNKMPIAIYAKMDRFYTHEIQLEKGDLIYMFSDGYADQFGGPKGKKFKYKPFKRILIENANKSMQEQKENLDKVFEDWKGSSEQIDDVVVLGIKI